MQTIAGFAEGEELRVLISALKSFTKNNSPMNTIAERQKIADVMISANAYIFRFVMCNLQCLICPKSKGFGLFILAGKVENELLRKTGKLKEMF